MLANVISQLAGMNWITSCRSLKVALIVTQTFSFYARHATDERVLKVLRTF
jgi:hypothetical protein